MNTHFAVLKRGRGTAESVVSKIHRDRNLELYRGDDVKTVQTNLGHRSADFTMKVYAYSPSSVKQESGMRMGERIRGLSEKPENGKL